MNKLNAFYFGREEFKTFLEEKILHEPVTLKTSEDCWVAECNGSQFDFYGVKEALERTLEVKLSSSHVDENGVWLVIYDSSQKWAEFENVFDPFPPNNNGDVETFVDVIAWTDKREKKDNDNGKTIARVFLTVQGDIVVDYIDESAKTDPSVQAYLMSTVDDLRQEMV